MTEPAWFTQPRSNRLGQVMKNVEGVHLRNLPPFTTCSSGRSTRSIAWSSLRAGRSMCRGRLLSRCDAVHQLWSVNTRSVGTRVDAPMGTPGLRVRLRRTIALLTIVAVGSTTGYAQAAQETMAVVDSDAPVHKSLFVNLDVSPDPFRSWPVNGANPPTGLAKRLPQAPTSSRSRVQARSTARVVAGAIVGSVGGFVAGGFLGAHIEGDRCNCDDPGVRGFLIGAPLGAATGGIFGAQFLF